MPSTVIAGMNYDVEQQTLKISYVSGHAYLYKNVPEKVYKELKASRVKGRYLRFFVKDNLTTRKYNYLACFFSITSLRISLAATLIF